MYTLLSPAKRLNEGPALPELPQTAVPWPGESTRLAKALGALGAEKLGSLMKLSETLSRLNHERYQVWQAPSNRGLGRQAALLFAGDTYVGLRAESLGSADFEFAQKHLGILSGLYGLLRPLDLIHPHRLEMGTRLKVGSSINLYGYWGRAIADEIGSRLAGHTDSSVINLASHEYFKAVQANVLPGQVITPVFMEVKPESTKVVGFVAKRARGTMARFIIKNRITIPEELKRFDAMDYSYREELSTENKWVFTRPAGPV